MDVIQNISTIRADSSNYKVHSRITKTLLVEFESHQNRRISKEKKPLIVSINQIQITRWAKDRLSVNHGSESYTDWEVMTACGVRLLLNSSYKYLKSEYGILSSTTTSHLGNICHPLKCINMMHLQQRANTGEVSISKLREVLQKFVKRNKVGRPTYLSPNEESFVVEAAEKEGANGLPIDTS